MSPTQKEYILNVKHRYSSRVQETSKERKASECSMDTKTIHLTTNEQSSLEYLYNGEINRDASSKIRGFIFQDLIAVQSLLDTSTLWAVPEFIEDVITMSQSGAIRFIQAKYYSESSVEFEEIITDFYYEYLQLELLGCRTPCEFQLAVHTNKAFTKPDLSRVMRWISPTKNSKPTPPTNAGEWLRANIFEKKKKGAKGILRKLTKQERKKTLFQEFAYSQSIEKFYPLFSVSQEYNLDRYQSNLVSQLKIAFPPEKFMPVSNSNGYSQILMGLAMEFVQNRYKSTSPKFESLLLTKDNFSQNITAALTSTNDRNITAYLTGIVLNEYITILDSNPRLTEAQIKLLSEVCKNTKEWISDLASTVNGQFALINSMSKKNLAWLETFKAQDSNQRRDEIISCETEIRMFLDYLWKIICDIYREHYDSAAPIDASKLDPRTYIDSSEDQYICLRFPNDHVEKSAILPPIYWPKQRVEITNTYDRMEKCRPQKWYQSGPKRGIFTYKINPAEGNVSSSVADMAADDIFFIECMECIAIDADGFSQTEKCSTCIFNEECIHNTSNQSEGE